MLSLIATTKMLVLSITLATGPKIEAALPADICISVVESFDYEAPIYTEEGEALDVEQIECLLPVACQEAEDGGAERHTNDSCI